MRNFFIAISIAIFAAFLVSQAWAGDSGGILGWLKSIGLEKYETEFRDNEITLNILPELTDADLKEMGIKSLGARKRILQAIKKTPSFTAESSSENLEAMETPESPEGVVTSNGPCERPILPNTVDLAQIPQRVRDDLGRHLDTPLAKPFRPLLLAYTELAGPNWELYDEVIYTDPPYTIYRRTQEYDGQHQVQIGISLPGGVMSIVATGDYGWDREHLDFTDFEYIEPEVDVVIDGISSRDISLSFTWEMLINEGANNTASRSFTKQGWVVGSKEVDVEINGESFRLMGFKLKHKMINQNKVYVKESVSTWVPHINQTVEWKTTKERWSGGSRSYRAVEYSNFKTTPEVMTYLRCVEAAR